ncbi:hypothetical protein [Streptomyces incanus]|uniref:Uncharacterized protein n=1 Tax=Streptomyces incanus TaxID=887453 RepID=A0ABW0XKD2_9ACTN
MSLGTPVSAGTTWPCPNAVGAPQDRSRVGGEQALILPLSCSALAPIPQESPEGVVRT